MATGRAHVLLMHAFSNLPNLRTLGIRDYNGKGRWRDGEKATWRSYGWSSGEEPLNSSRRLMIPDTVLPLILHSLDGASTGLERIEVFLRRSRLPDDSFDISDDFMRSRAVPVLSNLKVLLLSISDPENMRQRTTYQTSKPENGAFPNLKNFLTHTPQLQHLRLNFDPNQQPTRCIEAFLTWLSTSSGPDVDMAPAPVTLDWLTTLDLGMVHVKPRTLFALVSKIANLEALSLWKVTAHSIPSDLDVMLLDVSCLWAFCLRKLSESFQSPENIKTLMIGWLTEYVNMRPEPRPVSFAGRSTVDEQGNSTRQRFEDVATYRKEVGSNVCTWLGALGERARLPLTIENVTSEEEFDEDDDEEHDEDGGSQFGDSEDEEEVVRMMMQREDEILEAHGQRDDDDDDNDDDDA